MQPGITTQTASIVDDEFQQSAVFTTHLGLLTFAGSSRAGGSKIGLPFSFWMDSLPRTACARQAEIGKRGTLPARYGRAA